MELLKELLPVILYFLLCILVVVLIIFVIRAIKSLKNIDEVVNDVKGKSQQLNGVFNIIDNVTDSLAIVGDKFVSFISSSITSVFKKKRKDEEDE